MFGNQLGLTCMEVLIFAHYASKCWLYNGCRQCLVSIPLKIPFLIRPSPVLESRIGSSVDFQAQVCLFCHLFLLMYTYLHWQLVLTFFMWHAQYGMICLGSGLNTVGTMVFKETPGKWVWNGNTCKKLVKMNIDCIAVQWIECFKPTCMGRDGVGKSGCDVLYEDFDFS